MDDQTAAQLKVIEDRISQLETALGQILQSHLADIRNRLVTIESTIAATPVQNDEGNDLIKNLESFLSGRVKGIEDFLSSLPLPTHAKFTAPPISTEAQQSEQKA